MLAPRYQWHNRSEEVCALGAISPRNGYSLGQLGAARKFQNRAGKGNRESWKRKVQSSNLIGSRLRVAQRRDTTRDEDEGKESFDCMKSNVGH